MNEDFVSETWVSRRKMYLIDFPLREFRDPNINHKALLRDRFQQIFGENAFAFGPITTEVLQTNLPANSVEILVIGYVQYYVPSNKKSEDYLG